MGLHVAQAGIVIGVNKGEMNLKAEKKGADVRGILGGTSLPELSHTRCGGECRI